MGRARIVQPTLLPEKLKQIRLKQGWSQQQMAERLAKPGLIVRPGHVSEYETGKRNVSLLILLQYARLAGVSVESLIDDRLKLPKT